MESFTKKQVNEKMGISLRAIQYYTERGLVKPEVDHGEGRGGTRRYSRRNLVEFGIIRVLSAYGMAFDRLKRLFELATGNCIHIHKDGRLIIDPAGFWVTVDWDTDDFIAMEYPPCGRTQSILKIDMGNISDRAGSSTYFDELPNLEKAA